MEEKETKKNYKKRFIAIMIVSIIAIMGILVVISVLYNTVNKDWTITIQDVSMNCKSNLIYVYKDGKYVITDARTGDVVERNKFDFGDMKNYKGMEKTIKNHASTEESSTPPYYKITFNDDKVLILNSNDISCIDMLVKQIDPQYIVSCMD